MMRSKAKSNIESTQADAERERFSREDNGSEEKSFALTAVAEQDANTLRAGLEKVTAERDALLDRTARTQAEFENIRKRLLREQQDFKDFALENALKSLLPSLDSFDQALQTPSQNPEEFRSGVELIRKQLHDAISKLGVTPILAKGEPFDPLLHEAVEIVDNPAAEDNQVQEELLGGYKLKHRLLRPAMVRVARNPRK
jgi:molecular chaperone GrpE